MFSKSSLLFIFVVALFGLPSCDNRSAQAPADESTRRFIIPENGMLSEKQVTDYIVIRQKINREVTVRDRTELMDLVKRENEENKRQDYRYFDEIEETTANKAGMSYEEFLWIKDTVISTQTSMWLQRYYELNNKIVTLLDATLTNYRHASGNNQKNQAQAQEQDQQERKILDSYVNEMKMELKNLQGKIINKDDQAETLVHNSAIIAKYITELESLDTRAK